MEEDSPDAGTGWPRAGEDFSHHPVPLRKCINRQLPSPLFAGTQPIRFPFPFFLQQGLVRFIRKPDRLGCVIDNDVNIGKLLVQRKSKCLHEVNPPKIQPVYVNPVFPVFPIRLLNVSPDGIIRKPCGDNHPGAFAQQAQCRMIPDFHPAACHQCDIRSQIMAGKALLFVEIAAFHTIWNSGDGRNPSVLCICNIFVSFLSKPVDADSSFNSHH